MHEPHTPWLVQIQIDAEGQPPQPVVVLDLAQEAAEYLTAYADRTEPVDPEHGYWNVWLPDRMTDKVWATGIDLDLRVGGYRLRMDFDPA